MIQEQVQVSEVKRLNLRPAKLISNNIVWILLVAAIVIMGLFDHSFYSPSILQNVLVQTSVLGVVTAGIAQVLLVGEIDLSVTGIMGFGAGLGTILMVHGFPWYLSIVVTVLFGVLIGVVNGLLVTWLKAAALIETLAMGLILQGGLMALTQGESIVNFPNAYTWIGQGQVWGIPILPIPFLLVYFIVHFVWKHTVFGRALFATGGNPLGAYVSGINISKMKILAFTISGGLAGLGGYLLASYMGAVTTNFGSDLQMYTLAAAVIGGVSLTGGKGRISGVLAGVLLLTVIDVGLQVLNINSFYVTMAGGIMIFVAVIVDALKNKFGQ